MKKKIVCVLLGAALCCGLLAGCGSNSSSQEGTQTQTQTTTTQQQDSKTDASSKDAKDSSAAAGSSDTSGSSQANTDSSASNSHQKAYQLGSCKFLSVPSTPPRPCHRLPPVLMPLRLNMRLRIHQWQCLPCLPGLHYIFRRREAFR